MKKKSLIESLIYIIVFLILGFFTVKLSLYLDDYSLIFPAIYKNYHIHFQNYLKDFGLFRPLSLIYYYLIYSVYIYLPWLAHLIPLTMLIFTGFILSKTLKAQGLRTNQSFAISMILITLPFVVESFSWLIANNSLIVLTIFITQIYLIESNFLNKNLLKVILYLQLISVFIYETTIFMSFAVAYLLYVTKREKNKLKLFLFSLFPIGLYIFTKLIYKPQFELRSKFINLSDAINNWASSLSQLKSLFSVAYLSNFWGKEILEGFNIIINQRYILFLIVGLLLLIIVKLFINNENGTYNPVNGRFRLFFWLLCLILSLIPLSWQKGYLPFRTLLLPSISILIVLVFCSNQIIIHKHNGLIKFVEFCLKIIFIILVTVFLTIQISMLNQYYSQYVLDKKITSEINKKLEILGFEHPYRSNLYLKRLNRNNFNRLLYGDYLFTNYNYYWSAEALLDLNSGSFSKLGIEFPDENNFSSSVSKEDFLKLRPLAIMSFTDNISCLKKECLKVEAVYQKPY